MSFQNLRRHLWRLWRSKRFEQRRASQGAHLSAKRAATSRHRLRHYRVCLVSDPPWSRCRREPCSNSVGRETSTMSDARKKLNPILPNPPRWEPQPDPTSIEVPGLDSSASVNDQIDQIEQLITIKLQVRPVATCLLDLRVLHRPIIRAIGWNDSLTLFVSEYRCELFENSKHLVDSHSACVQALFRWN